MAEQAASQGSGVFGGTAAFELSQSFPLAFTTKRSSALVVAAWGVASFPILKFKNLL